MNIKLTLKSTVISVIIACICLFISGALVHYNLITNKLGSIILFIALLVSSLTGAFISAKVCEEKILLNALFVGVFLSLIIFIMAIVVNNSPAIHPRTLVLMGGIIATSVLGAILANK